MKEDTKEKIMETVVDLVGVYGIDEITTRMIAESGQVNVASVNYYFGSKENLIKDASDFFFKKQIQPVFSILDDTRYTPRERIYLFYAVYIRRISKYPGFARSIVKYILNGDSAVMAAKIPVIRELLLKIAALVTGYIGESHEVVTMRVMNVMSAILFPMVMDSVYPLIVEGVNLSDETTRDLYIATLLTSLFALDLDTVKLVITDEVIQEYEET